MNRFKSAFTGISHNKCRFIILIVVVCFFALSIALSAAVVNGTAKKAQEYKNSLATGFVITLDYINPDWVFIDENGDGKLEYIGPRLDMDTAEEIMCLPGVSGCNLQNRLSINSNIELRHGLYKEMIDAYSSLPDEEKDAGILADIEEAKNWQNITNFYSVSESENCDYFRTGAFELVGGRHIQSSDENVVIISDYIAEQNGLNIGDSFEPEMKAYMIEFDDTKDETVGEPVSLEVVGIFKANIDQGGDSVVLETEYADNLMFTDTKTMSDWRKDALQYKNSDRDAEADNFDSITVFTDGSVDMDSLIAEVRKILGVNSSFYDIRVNDADYAGKVIPLDIVSNITSLFMVLISAACIFALCIVLVMVRAAKCKDPDDSDRYSSADCKHLVIRSLIACAIGIVIGIIIAASLVNPITGNVERKICELSDGQDGGYTYYYDSDYDLKVAEGLDGDIDLDLGIGVEETVTSIAVCAGAVIIVSLIAGKMRKNK